MWHKNNQSINQLLTFSFLLFNPSTDAVFPHGLRDCAEDADMIKHASQLTDGYSQSKWVAEQLVIKAMERGLPAAIYRPGIELFIPH